MSDPHHRDVHRDDVHHYDVAVDPSDMNNPHSLALMLVGENQQVLEIGCSAGHVTRHLVERGNVVTGVELDADALELAKPHLAAGYALDLDNAKVSAEVDGPFDVIVLGDVLEHVRRPPEVLADLVTLLADDGRFVISLPNVAHQDVRLMLLGGEWDYQWDGLLDDTHLRWFTRASIRRLLEQCDLIATQVHRVVVPVLGSNVPVNEDVMTPAVMAIINHDPDSGSYQFVFEARRRAEGMEDALAIEAVDFSQVVIPEPEPEPQPAISFVGKVRRRLASYLWPYR